MAEILGQWKFLEHGKPRFGGDKNELLLDVDQWHYWDQVLNLSTEWLEADIVILKAWDFEGKIEVIINDIISGWIQNFLPKEQS